jgi:hypothetical protein
MRELTNLESQFAAGGGTAEALFTGFFLTALTSLVIVSIVSPSPYDVSKTTNCGWQPYLREERKQLYDAYGNPTGLDDVLLIEDYQWVCV